MDERVRCVASCHAFVVDIWHANWLLLERSDIPVEFEQIVEVAFERRLERDGTPVFGAGEDAAQAAGFFRNLANGHKTDSPAYFGRF